MLLLEDGERDPTVPTSLSPSTPLKLLLVRIGIESVVEYETCILSCVAAVSVVSITLTGGRRKSSLPMSDVLPEVSTDDSPTSSGGILLPKLLAGDRAGDLDDLGEEGKLPMSTVVATLLLLPLLLLPLLLPPRGVLVFDLLPTEEL